MGNDEENYIAVLETVKIIMEEEKRMAVTSTSSSNYWRVGKGNLGNFRVLTALTGMVFIFLNAEEVVKIYYL